MTAVTAVEVREVGGGIGAEVSGVDLGTDHPPQVYSAIWAAVERHGVAFLRDQHLSAERWEAVAGRFGEIQVSQELRKEPDQTRNVGESWHVDMTFLPAPPMATMLLALECPPRGGDTMLASMALAYEGLSEGLQASLRGLRAVHANVRKLALDYDRTSPPEPSVSEYDAAEGTLHPVVIRHPGTGRRVLYVNPEYTARFDGWTRKESLGLLSYLYAHAERPEHTCRFRWSPGSVAIWDNRQVWHLAVNDYQGLRRVMRRVTLRGEPPVAAR